MAYERVNWENLPSTKTPINQTNLNKMENGIDQAGAEIFVGAEEPTTGEKVWFRKGKNIFNFYNIQTEYYNAKLNTKSNNSSSITNMGNWAYALLNLNLKPNTIYTLSADVTNSNGAYCGFYINNNIDGCKNGDKSFKSAITFTTDETGVQNVFAYVNKSATTAASTYTVTFNNVQLEQGSKATSYEAYIEPQIFVRNSNGVYEEFAKKSEEVYSTEEQVIGTWIDGKPLYRKVVVYKNTEIIGTKGKIVDIGINHNISNFKQLCKLDCTSSTGNVLPVSIGSTDGTNIDFGTRIFQVDSKYINLKLYNDTWGQREWYITLEYTKTTD